MEQVRSLHAELARARAIAEHTRQIINESRASQAATSERARCTREAIDASLAMMQTLLSSYATTTTTTLARL